MRKYPYNMVNRYNNDLIDQHSAKKVNLIYIIKKQREEMLQTKGKANFKCPDCGIYFDIRFGTFGKTKCFEQATYHCKNCVKQNPSFIKM